MSSGRTVAGERWRNGGEGREVSFRPGSSRLFQLQWLRLTEQLASPTESGTGAAQSNGLYLGTKKKEPKIQTTAISHYVQMTSCLPGRNIRKMINTKKSAVIVPERRCTKNEKRA